MTALAPQDLDRAACAARDAADPLAALREQFDLPDVSNAADLKLMAETAQWAN